MENNEQHGEIVPYATLFNEGPDAIIIADQAGGIKHVNMRAVEVLGYKPDELVGMTIHDIVVFSRENQLQDVLNKLNEIRFYLCDSYCTRKNGQQFVADIVVTRITFESNSHLYFFIRDATQRREMEEKVRNMNKVRSLHMLTGSVAHDFNNMLTSIVGHMELAMNTISARSRASEDLATALQDAKRMSELSRRMLEYSGKGLIEKTNIDFGTILSNVSDKMMPRVPSHVIMNVAVSSDPIPVNGENDLLESAVRNILLNALEAVDKTGGSVSASCTIENIDADTLVSTFTNSALPPGEYACLSITDTGYGMDSIILGKIFEPFFSTKGSGRGLGLTETQGIVLAHGGTITVSTQPGNGSTIKIFLPISRKTAGKRASIAVQKQGQKTKRTILIVDDDPSVRRYSGRIMEKLGFSTLTAEDGESGINQFRLHADEIDLVIVDMFMPRLNGDEVIRAIRKIRSNAKVMIISGYTETIFMDRFKENQPDGFLYKPFVTGDFVDKITQILDLEITSR